MPEPIISPSDAAFAAADASAGASAGADGAAVTIRAAASPDVPALAELAAATFPLACPPHITAESIADFIASNFTPAHFEAYLADPQRALIVAEGQAAAAAPGSRPLLGWAMLVAGDPIDADVATAVTARPAIELSKFYTRAEMHGAGVAAPLMHAVLDVAEASRAAVCWLGVNQENARAIRFYEKHGFAEVGRKRFRVGDRLEHDFVLARPITT